jgi:hypothetical protein
MRKVIKEKVTEMAESVKRQGTELDGRGVGVRFAVRASDFSLVHITTSPLYPASYPVVNSGSFLGGKPAGA